MIAVAAPVTGIPSAVPAVSSVAVECFSLTAGVWSRRGDSLLPLQVLLGPRVCVCGLSVLPIPATFLFVLLLVLRLLPLLLLLLPLLTALLLLLAAAVPLHGVSVELEQLPRVEVREVGDEEPEGAAPLPTLVLGHLVYQTVDVFPNLDQTPPCVDHLEKITRITIC